MEAQCKGQSLKMILVANLPIIQLHWVSQILRMFTEVLMVKQLFGNVGFPSWPGIPEVAEDVRSRGGRVQKAAV